MIDFDNKITEFYPYRRAFVNASINIELNRVQKEQTKTWIRDNGYMPDNHITWKDETGMWYTLSDSVLYVGSSVSIRNW